MAQEPIRWHTKQAEDCVRELQSDAAAGLTTAEASTRLARDGANELREGSARTILDMLKEQLSSVMTLILIGAAVLAAVLGKYVDAGAIGAIVVLFIVLGIMQEYKAQKAISALKRMAAPVVRVLRGGAILEIPSRDLVVGDVIKLEAGNSVPADSRLIEAANLRVMEAALTGEAEPVEKETHVLENPEIPVGDRINMVYMGTHVTAGRGAAIVVGTGMATELGHVATLLQSVKNEATPLQRRLDRLAKGIAVIAGIVALFVLISGVMRGEPAADMLLLAVSIAVAIVPEGLPAVMTFTLALGAQRMLKRKALIRKLPAVETLGSVTVICSDKTGTLTQNKMTVTRGFAPENAESFEVAGNHAPREFTPVLIAGTLCNDGVLSAPVAGQGPAAVGDPTETAIVVAAAKVGLMKGELEATFVRLAEVPFDSDRKRMSTFHSVWAPPATAGPELRGLAAWGNGGTLMFTKGAADQMIDLCTARFSGGHVKPFDAEDKRRIQAIVDRETRGGLRVLAVGARRFDALPAAADLAKCEADLVFVGLLCMIDPPRDEARDAVTVCKRAGIRPIMITGDHPLTAKAIAAYLGITTLDARVVTGVEIDRMSEAELSEAAGSVGVFARVSPEHKLRIVEALQKRGEVVAMTGDGVNDAPALKKADIGVAMGTGTDVAKEAADMVLVDDNFATIVAAIEEGRVVYDNLKRFLVFSISGNVGKVLLVAVPPLWGMPVLLKPIQILWSNLLTDGLLGLGMGVEKGEPDVMTRPPISPKESVFSGGFAWHVVWVGLLMTLVVVGVAKWYYLTEAANWGTVAFMTLAMMQLGRAIAMRSFQYSGLAKPISANPMLFGMLGAALVLQLLVVYVPFLQGYFATLALSPLDLAISTACGVFMLAVLELAKAGNRAMTKA